MLGWADDWTPAGDFNMAFILYWMISRSSFNGTLLDEVTYFAMCDMYFLLMLR